MAQMGENNPHWKGDGVKYRGLHMWLQRKKPKTGICNICGKTKKTVWASIDGKYPRRLAHYIELCVGCHHVYDNVYQKIWSTRRMRYGR